jgi:hypothetical protein
MSIADLLHQSQRVSSASAATGHPAMHHHSTSQSMGPSASPIRHGGGSGVMSATGAASRSAPGGSGGGMSQAPPYSARPVVPPQQHYSRGDVHGYGSMHAQSGEFRPQHQHLYGGGGGSGGGSHHHMMMQQQQQQLHLHGDSSGRGGYSSGESYGGGVR